VLEAELSQLSTLQPYLLHAGTVAHLRLSGQRGLCSAAALYESGHSLEEVHPIFERIPGEQVKEDEIPPFLQLRDAVIARVLCAKEIQQPGVYGGNRFVYLVSAFVCPQVVELSIATATKTLWKKELFQSRIYFVVLDGDVESQCFVYDRKNYCQHQVADESGLSTTRQVEQAMARLDITREFYLIGLKGQHLFSRYLLLADGSVSLA